MDKIKTVTLNIPGDLYETYEEIAKEREESIEEFLTKAIVFLECTDVIYLMD